MSLGIVFKGAEGIVLVADSRITLTNTATTPNGKEITHSYFDNSQKLLRINGQNNLGALTYGTGVILQPHPRTAHSFLSEFETSLGPAKSRRALSVEDFASKLSEFYLGQWQKGQMPPDAQPMIFMVGGYDKGAPYGRVFELSIPTAPEPNEIFTAPGHFGMVWGGQKEFADRIIVGYDDQLPGAAQQILELTDEQREKLRNDLKQHTQTKIPFEFLPLQDCVDLAILVVRTTAALHGLITGIRGVGGPVDVATITRTHGFESIQQKSIIGEIQDIP